ncbi:MAG: hypothetical protein LBR99_04395, partial [Treponema sp.]|nr:hypothetical protein [Treponema sp.]
RLSDQDIYVNVAGGIRVTEVGAELALACAIYSARTGLPLPGGLAIAGELSLTGELRPVRRLAGRIRTGRNLGFTGFLGPDGGEAPGEPEAGSGEKAASGGNAVSEKGFQAVKDIKTAIRAVFGEKPPKF